MAGPVVAALPPVTVPFAVREMPHVQPDLWPLTRAVPAHVEDDGPPTLVRLDAEVPALVAAARAAVRADPRPWTSYAPDLDAELAGAAGRELGRAVSRAVPSLLVQDGEQLTATDLGVRVSAGGHVERVSVAGPRLVGGEPAEVIDRLAAVPPMHRYLELVALTVAEDIVLVDATARAVWLHVCAPSGWDPGAAAGLPLAALHGPVPTAGRLRAASTALAGALVHSGPHVRWVWGLTDDPAAAHHPRFRDAGSVSSGDVAELTFRAERQTTLPLPHLGLGVFLIRVHRAPLGQIVRTPERRARLATAIASLPDELAAYKGVIERRGELLAWLGDTATAQ